MAPMTALPELALKGDADLSALALDRISYQPQVRTRIHHGR